MTSPSNCPWVKISDLIETSLWISIENITTRTQLERAEGLQLIEISDQGMTLQIPARTCSLGHLLIVRLEKRKLNPLEPGDSSELTEEFQATAKVVELEALNPKAVTIVVKFYQFQEDSWNKFIADFSSRMTELNRQLRKVQD